MLPSTADRVPDYGLARWPRPSVKSDGSFLPPSDNELLEYRIVERLYKGGEWYFSCDDTVKELCDWFDASLMLRVDGEKKKWIIPGLCTGDVIWRLRKLGSQYFVVTAGYFGRVVWEKSLTVLALQGLSGGHMTQLSFPIKSLVFRVRYVGASSISLKDCPDAQPFKDSWKLLFGDSANSLPLPEWRRVLAALTNRRGPPATWVMMQKKNSKVEEPLLLPQPVPIAISCSQAPRLRYTRNTRSSNWLGPSSLVLKCVDVSVAPKYLLSMLRKIATSKGQQPTDPFNGLLGWLNERWIRCPLALQQALACLNPPSMVFAVHLLLSMIAQLFSRIALSGRPVPPISLDRYYQSTEPTGSAKAEPSNLSQPVDNAVKRERQTPLPEASPDVLAKKPKLEPQQ